jgi:signal peptidase II
MRGGLIVKLESRYLALAAVASVVVILDQLTKLYIHTHFAVGESVPVIAQYFNITYVRNTGAAFGILRDSLASFREMFFLLMPPIAMVIIVAILRGVSNQDRWQVLALSLIFGGAAGNYIDRLRFGYVIDFLDFHLRDFYSWPSFNVADSAIVVGVCLLLLLMTFVKQPEKASA